MNIVPGHYKFTLTVTDAEGMESQDSMSLVVQPGSCNSTDFTFLAFYCILFHVFVFGTHLRLIGLHQEGIGLKVLVSIIHFKACK